MYAIAIHTPGHQPQMLTICTSGGRVSQGPPAAGFSSYPSASAAANALELLTANPKTKASVRKLAPNEYQIAGPVFGWPANTCAFARVVHIRNVVVIDELEPTE